MSGHKPSILFVCLGNICRSTMAEGVFRSTVASGPYRDRLGTIDSCGTASYHVGSPPDTRTLDTLSAHGIRDYAHTARQVRDGDFDAFDYVLAMDGDNLHDLRARRGQRQAATATGGGAKVMLWGAFADEDADAEENDKGVEVRDPYYSGMAGFEAAYEQCVRFSRNFLRRTFPDIKEGDGERG